MLNQGNVRVLAVAGRLHPYPRVPGRFIGRVRREVKDASGALLHVVYDPMEDGELVAYDIDIVKALQVGDLELVSMHANEKHDHAPGPKRREAAPAAADAPTVTLEDK